MKHPVGVVAFLALVALLAAGVVACGDGGQSTTTASTAADRTASPADTGTTSGLTYPIVDSGQITFYDAAAEISAPASGDDFYGQDAQNDGNKPSYTLSDDGLTVTDNVTGLVWEQSPDTNGDGTIDTTDKMSFAAAQEYPATLNAEKFGGYDDWRLPTIKDLYSLIQFTGTDPDVAATDTSGLTPFIDGVFDFAYGDTANGERIIDSQYVTTTQYVSTVETDGELLFGVNFADGRIKGYGLTLFGKDKTFSVLCVRGNTDYGVNAFADNGDGTITDSATGLMWSQTDSAEGMNWKAALAWVQTKNAEDYLGHSDWRLPNVKELQSIVDYTRSPDTTDSAAIDPLFECTQITNEAGETDYPFIWSGTTHASSSGSGSAGSYVCFGRAMGYMDSTWMDVHGAGAQRSDPKKGSAAD
ncbi:MAG TPA: DUF1566 domain-containing protein, partial [Thermoleophilia bacterium]|nr:DUF1566 domain-containing protein [Thermoleophilia bacterium]